jgi:DNA end-binding protein Ku
MNVSDSDFAGHMPTVELSEKELKMAQQLIQSQITDFLPELYENQHHKQVMDLSKVKLSSNRLAPPGNGKVVDLMAALEASIKPGESGEG